MLRCYDLLAFVAYLEFSLTVLYSFIRQSEQWEHEKEIWNTETVSKGDILMIQIMIILITHGYVTQNSHILH